MIFELFQEGNYTEIANLYADKSVSDSMDTTEIRKVAESFRRIGNYPEAVRWQERLVQLKPDGRNLDKLKDLYLHSQVSAEQWGDLRRLAEGVSEEAAVIARFFEAKTGDCGEGQLRELARRMAETAAYDDEIYFAVAELLDREYYLNRIVERSQNEENRGRARKLLAEKKDAPEEAKALFYRKKEEKRQIPESVENQFADIVGMENIKEELGSLYYHRTANGKKVDTIAVPFNFFILGQPGSGKTMLAGAIAKLLKESGLTKTEDMLEISAVSLLEDMELLTGDASIIVVNDTECLWNASKESKTGEQSGQGSIWMVVERLLEEACRKQDKFYMFLGEADAMEAVLKEYPKLNKFVTVLKIPVYSGKELHEIGLRMLKQDGYEISGDGSERFYQELRKQSVVGDFANGHSIYRLLIEAKKRLAYRVRRTGSNRRLEEDDFKFRVSEEETLEELLQQLHGMIGLSAVKREVEEKIAMFRQNENNRKAGLDTELKVSLNTLLLGPPGTGKTTVARLLGKIYGQIGLLPRGDIFVEVTRESLVAGYSGQTALKVDALVKKAMGGVLFIDEAYNLVTGDNDDFGKEAFQTLLTKAENYRDRLMIIMAGYEEPMRRLLSVNEGMARRFPHELHFESYTEEELLQIFHSLLEQKGYFLHVDAEKAVKRLIKGKMCRSNFGNAGEIRNMLEGMLQKMSVRVYHQKIEGNTDRRTIRKTDVEEYAGHSAETEKTLEDYLEELEALTGLESVKEHVRIQIKSAKIAQERARRAGIAYTPGSLHMLLVGNAGTGKTTVARLIGKIYGKAGLIKNEDVFVEIRRESLVAGYMGQTGSKVINEVERAGGGVMFIDEAYHLVLGPHDEFGKDALNTLIAPIENNRDDLMVIMAGYEEEMEELLRQNQGLRSRINTKLVLEDYTIDQMVEIFYKKAAAEGYRIEEGLEDYVKEFLLREKEKANPDFGNARGVRNSFEAVIRRMNARLIAGEGCYFTEEQLRRLSDEEISTIRKEDFGNEE